MNEFFNNCTQWKNSYFIKICSPFAYFATVWVQKMSTTRTALIPWQSVNTYSIFVYFCFKPTNYRWSLQRLSEVNDWAIWTYKVPKVASFNWLQIIVRRFSKVFQLIWAIGRQNVIYYLHMKNFRVIDWSNFFKCKV